MKKIFASDFDGTLYFHRETVKLPPESVQKIRECQKAGTLFGICTGRWLDGVVSVIKDYFKPDFYITSSGACLVDGNLQEIQKHGIDRRIVNRIVKMLLQSYERVMVHIDDAMYSFAEIEYQGNYHIIEKINEIPSGMIHQISVHTDGLEEAAAVSQQINAQYGTFVEAFQNVCDVDIAPKGCSKGEALRVLQKHFRTQFDECRLYGIGDSINDLPLLKTADVSYTFPYAPKSLQQEADFVVDTICDALEHCIADQ